MSAHLRLTLLLLLAGSSACGPSIGERVAPKPSTYADASGADTSCNPADEHAAPLVVDSKAEQRAELEVAMKRGIAVVAYDCKRLRVLGDCHLDGEYEFMGVSPKEELIRLESSADVELNLPFGGFGPAAQLGAGLSGGTTLDVALAMVGKKMSTPRSAKRSSLGGACKGATHFVRGATVGAFTMATGTEANVRTAVEVFGLGVSADASHRKSVVNRDGSLDACKGADPAALAPPGSCSSLIRLDLTALDSGPPDPDVPVFAEATCPTDTLLVGGKCTRASAERHQCRPGKLADCDTQCGKGEARSCAILGDMLSRGKWANRDDARAAEVFKKACTLGDEHGCNGLGVAYLDGKGVPKDEARGVELLRKACDAGSAKGCTSLGYAATYGKGVPKDEARAAAWFEHACRGGEERGCANLGVLALEGRGVPKDLARAVALLKRACAGHDASGCYNLARLADHGTGMPKDVATAVRLFRQACDGGEAFSCNNLGTHYVQGNGVAKDLALAAKLFETACKGDPTGCSNLATLTAAGKGVAKDPARALSLYQRACEAGDAAGCEQADKLARQLCADKQSWACGKGRRP